MKKVNLNDFARLITLEEGLENNVNIGDVKEILRLTFAALSLLPLEDVANILKRYKKPNVTLTKLGLK